MKKKVFSLSVVALGALSLLAMSACTPATVPSENGEEPSANTYSGGYKDGFMKAREMAMQQGLPQREENTFLTGIVVSANGNSLVLDISGLVLDEKVDGVGSRRTATVSDDTTIVMLEEVPGEEFQRLNTEFVAKISAPQGANDTPPVPPSPYREKTAAMEDIKVGSQVTVEAVNGENLTLLPQFAVSKITMAPVPVVMDTPAVESAPVEAMTTEESAVAEGAV